MKKLILMIFLITNYQSFSQSIYDDCPSSGTGITVGTTCANSSYNYSVPNNFSASSPAPSCASNNDDGWVIFTATSNNTVINTTITGGDDVAIELWSGCGTLLTCANSGGGNQPENITFATTIGTSYRVRIINQSGANGQFNGTICVYSPSSGTTLNNDCVNATQVCSDQSFSGNSTGAGTISDLTATNRGCLSVEHQSSWYFFQAATSGTIELTITTTVDYDFAIWGPNVNCSSLGHQLGVLLLHHLVIQD